MDGNKKKAQVSMLVMEMKRDTAMKMQKLGTLGRQKRTLTNDEMVSD